MTWTLAPNRQQLQQNRWRRRSNTVDRWSLALIF
jgi:hypothetical protein